MTMEVSLGVLSIVVPELIIIVSELIIIVLELIIIVSELIFITQGLITIVPKLIIVMSEQYFRCSTVLNFAVDIITYMLLHLQISFLCNHNLSSVDHNQIVIPQLFNIAVQGLDRKTDFF